MISERTVRDTELDKVLDIIRSSALSPEGRERITPDLVVYDRDEIERRARKVEEYMNLLSGTAPDSWQILRQSDTPWRDR